MSMVLDSAQLRSLWRPPRRRETRIQEPGAGAGTAAILITPPVAHIKGYPAAGSRTTLSYQILTIICCYILFNILDSEAAGISL